MYRHLKPVSRISSALKKKGTYSRRQQRGRSYPLHFSRSYPGITSLQRSSNDEDDSNATTIHHRHLVVRRSISSLSKEAATCAVDTPVGQRWWAVPPANAVHLAIGSVYVYSMWTPGMTHALGVVSASSLDWTHGQVLPVFSASAVCLGLTTSTLGSWVEKVGPRKSGFVGSAFWSAGLLTTAAGVHFHSLELLYAGWGLFGGIGWGLMYLSPVTTVMKWFPDQRGLATGMALSAFGAGAAIAPAFIQSFMDVYAIAPDYIGPLADMSKSATAAAGSSYPNDLYVTLTTLQDGTQVVAESSSMGETGQPVVVATAADLAQWPHVSTGPGAYVLGTGDTGTAKAMASLGVVYGAVGMLGSRFMTVPHPDWTPTGAVGKKEEILSKQEQMKEPNAVSVNTNDIGLPVSYVTRSTSQFPLLWLSVFGNATGGLALLSSSKLMLTDIWAGVAPGIVTAPFATAYVSALGVGMAVGRFGWSATSDYLGRKNTYALFGLGIPIVGMAPILTQTAMQSAAAAAAQTGAGAGTTTAVLLPLLTTFCGGSVLAITFYGGIFSVLPAYIADLFGQKHATAIHGKLLTAWACSAVAGPLGLAYLRGQAATSATHDLLGRVEDSAAFEQSFGCCLQDTETLQTLVDAKTITIGRLMELVPVGTVDPTPFLYDTTCYAAAGLMGVSLLSNMLIQPLNVPKVCRELEEAAATATATATVATNETNKKI